jgi:nicotinamide riboside kinase
MKVALLGAESTGKTRLSHELAAHFMAAGQRAVAVPEYLREWCERAGRTPRPHEQLAIAEEHERRVDAATAEAQIVIADTTALMVAIYSAILFEDATLYRFAIERQRGYDVTLVTGLDLAWVPDGLQRDGPHVREPVDALVREALAKAGIAYRVIYGSGPQRLANALAAIDGSLAAMSAPAPRRPWSWNCEKCSDPQCEHRLFTGLRDG